MRGYLSDDQTEVRNERRGGGRGSRRITRGGEIRRRGPAGRGLSTFRRRLLRRPESATVQSNRDEGRFEQKRPGVARRCDFDPGGNARLEMKVGLSALIVETRHDRRPPAAVFDSLDKAEDQNELPVSGPEAIIAHSGSSGLMMYLLSKTTVTRWVRSARQASILAIRPRMTATGGRLRTAFRANRRLISAAIRLERDFSGRTMSPHG